MNRIMPKMMLSRASAATTMPAVAAVEILMLAVGWWFVVLVERVEWVEGRQCMMWHGERLGLEVDRRWRRKLVVGAWNDSTFTMN
jgi:hypothetical protein